LIPFYINFKKRSQKVAKTITQSIRTTYWSHFLAEKLKTPYALGVQRIIDPGSIRMDGDKEISHSSKWSEYKNGTHSPRKTIVDKANTVVPGSYDIFNHLLWDVLERDQVSTDFYELLRKIHPNTRSLMTDPFNNVNTGASKQFLGKFERRAGLDSLATLTLLLKYNYENGFQERVWEYAHSIFRVLLIMGNHFDTYKVAEPIFRLFKERVFSLASWNNKKFCFEGFSYYIASEILFTMMWEIVKERRSRITPAQRVMLMLNILKYEEHPKLKMLFNPPLVQTSEHLID
jgi:hypothetical protein